MNNLDRLAEGLRAISAAIRNVAIFSDKLKYTTYKAGLDDIEEALEHDFHESEKIKEIVGRIYCALADLKEAIAEEQGQ